MFTRCIEHCSIELDSIHIESGAARDTGAPIVQERAARDAHEACAPVRSKPAIEPREGEQGKDEVRLF